MDFSGLSTMVDALDGVTLYVDEDIDDSEYTGLVLEQGCRHLDGTMALQYARVRHGVGDGSDISRISRQQNLMSAMLRTAQSKNLLTDADKLYSFAREALGTLTVSKGIADLTTVVFCALSKMTNALSSVRPLIYASGTISIVRPSHQHWSLLLFRQF